MVSLHDDLSYVLGGAILTNAVPYFVIGVTGRSFQSPFARLTGQGLSYATVNVFWGWINLALGYVLLLRVGDFDARVTDQAVAFGLGLLGMGVILARRFERFHGGSSPAR